LRGRAERAEQQADAYGAELDHEESREKDRSSPLPQRGFRYGVNYSPKDPMVSGAEQADRRGSSIRARRIPPNWLAGRLEDLCWG
jgi:hypothetical protein